MKRLLFAISTCCLLVWFASFVLAEDQSPDKPFVVQPPQVKGKIQAPATQSTPSQETKAQENSGASAEDVRSEAGKIVKGVDIKGNKTISMAAILTKIKTRVGDAYSPNVVSDDIKRLYNTGYFSDVTVETENVDNGVKVKMVLVEKPIIQKITFSKTRQYSASSLMIKIKSRKGRFFDRRDLKEDETILRDLYAKKGMTNVSVEVDTDMDQANNGVKLHYIVHEGERVKITKINFSGNKTFSYKRLIKVIKTRAGSLFTSGYLKKDILEEDIDRLKSFYANEGFLDAGASYSLQEISKSKLIINIQISEGKRYHLGSLTIVGNDKVFSTKEIQKAMTKLKVDGIFTPEKLQKDIADINSLYFDKGYIFSNIQESTSINSETGKVDVRLNITEGEIAYVNKVKVEGNNRTRDIVIRREVRLNPGDAFDGTKLRRTKERLKNLGYFEEVNYDIQDTKIPTKKDLVVQVKESKTGSFSFGGGYSTVDQLVGFIEVEQKNFDFRNWPTFTGGGQDLKVRGEIGSIRTNALLSFTEPWFFDMPISGGFDLYQSLIDRESDVGYAYNEKRTGLDLRLGKELTEYLSGSTIYRLEEIKLDNFASGVSNDLLSEEGRNRISSLSFNLTHDSRDDIINPTKGLVLGGTFDLAGGPLSGDKNYYRIKVKTSYDWPLLFGSVLECRFRAGVIDRYGDSDYVPVYERFYAGGAYSIRGYNERKVGPLDSGSGDPIGGKSMVVGNIEYTVPIVDFVKAAVFFDTGNVWEKVSDFSFNGYKSGTGVGLRVKTPIGPINLDYGYPLNNEPGEDKRSGKFYFSVSKSF
ncbi:MAG: outer membrane protein assembly factor BamA [Candidatus Omnitrophica bacterium]|nr:outer membrane protein assembly factor BamA [Candidatus Omnitrophota bacterium]